MYLNMYKSLCKVKGKVLHKDLFIRIMVLERSSEVACFQSLVPQVAKAEEKDAQGDYIAPNQGDTQPMACQGDTQPMACLNFFAQACRRVI